MRQINFIKYHIYLYKETDKNNHDCWHKINILFAYVINIIALCHLSEQ